MTFELGRTRTWRLPVFSALLMAFSASLRTDVLTILAVVEDSQGADCGLRYLYGLVSLQEPYERKECPSVA